MFHSYCPVIPKELPITKAEAEAEDARFWLLNELDWYLHFVATNPDSTSATWCAVEELFGYQLRTRASIYAMKMKKLGGNKDGKHHASATMAMLDVMAPYTSKTERKTQ